MRLALLAACAASFVLAAPAAAQPTASREAEIADQNRRSEALNAEVNRKNREVEARNAAAREAYAAALAEHLKAKQAYALELARHSAEVDRLRQAHSKAVAGWEAAVAACKAGNAASCKGADGSR